MASERNTFFTKTSAQQLQWADHLLDTIHFMTRTTPSPWNWEACFFLVKLYFRVARQQTWWYVSCPLHASVFEQGGHMHNFTKSTKMFTSQSCFVMRQNIPLWCPSWKLKSASRVTNMFPIWRFSMQIHFLSEWISFSGSDLFESKLLCKTSVDFREFCNFLCWTVDEKSPNETKKIAEGQKTKAPFSTFSHWSKVQCQWIKTHATCALQTEYPFVSAATVWLPEQKVTSYMYVRSVSRTVTHPNKRCGSRHHANGLIPWAQSVQVVCHNPALVQASVTIHGAVHKPRWCFTFWWVEPSVECYTRMWNGFTYLHSFMLHTHKNTLTNDRKLSLRLQIVWIIQK